MWLDTDKKYNEPLQMQEPFLELYTTMSITSVRDVDEPCYQEIVSRIYLGSCEAFKKDIITEKKITHVLSLGDFDNDLDVKIEYKVIEC